MRLWPSLFLLMLFLVGCGGPDGRWSISRIDGKPSGPSPRRLGVEFARGQMSAQTGCNGASGPYLAFAGHLWWTQPIKEHAMMCFPTGIMALEQQFVDRLARTVRYERVGSTLILRTDDGRSLTFDQAAATSAGPHPTAPRPST